MRAIFQHEMKEKTQRNKRSWTTTTKNHRGIPCAVRRQNYRICFVHIRHMRVHNAKMERWKVVFFHQNAKRNRIYCSFSVIISNFIITIFSLCVSFTLSQSMIWPHSCWMPTATCYTLKDFLSAVALCFPWIQHLCCMCASPCSIVILESRAIFNFNQTKRTIFFFCVFIRFPFMDHFFCSPSFLFDVKEI